MKWVEGELAAFGHDGFAVADGEDGTDGVSLKTFLADLQGQLDEGVNDLGVKALSEVNAFHGNVFVERISDLDLHEGVNGFSKEACDAYGDVFVLNFFAGSCCNQCDFDALNPGVVIGGHQHDRVFLFAQAFCKFF